MQRQAARRVLALTFWATAAASPAFGDVGERSYIVSWGDELDLVTRAGAYSIVLGDGCDWVKPDIEVVAYAGQGAKILSPVDSDGQCFLVGQELVDKSPCEMTQGQCDVALAHIGAPPESAFQSMREEL